MKKRSPWLRLLAALVAMLSLAVPLRVAEAQVFSVSRPLIDSTAASSTTYVTSQGHEHIRLYLYVADDGDGGSATYAVTYCQPTGPGTCTAFTPAITGTLTVGGTTEALVEINVPFAKLKVAYTSNTVKANIIVELDP